MLTQSSKVFLPVSVVAVLFGLAYRLWAGDLLGTTLFLMLGAVAFVLGVMIATVRENEVTPPTAADIAPPEVRPVAVAPVPGGAGWSLLGGLAVGLVTLGLVVSPVMVGAGVLVGLAAAAGWLARASGESTGRLPSLMPIGLPVVGLFAIGSLMFLISRILLAVPEKASTGIALAVAVTILGVASLFALRPSVSGRAMVAGLAVAGVLLTAGGIVAAAKGERKVEKHAAGEGAIELSAKGLAFDKQDLALKADAETRIRFTNDDAPTPHNVAIDSDGGQNLFRGELATDKTPVVYTFKAPAAGTYKFHCDVHPTMKGTVTVT
jgi:plastocyanin